ncbi:MAG: hypothetical protein IKA72_01760 [Clostridia bacterium]|nr:hypothetical protein [Clostridia bacterium]
MRDKFKKLTSVAIAGTMAFATVALSACGDKNYKGTKLDGFDAAATVTSNGGFAVKKGDYVYFVNGQEDYKAENKYGEVTKGALMRIKSSDLTSGNYDKAQTVVPMLFSAQNFDAGIYLYGDSVYYATPTTDKDLDGNVANDWIDFKSAKLDGSSAMKSNYFRLENNAVQYRFVQENGVVYCLYVDGGNLYSFNTQSRETQTLVVGASTYYFDESDAENANVYYLMDVTSNIDSDNSTTFDYNQIYSVNAAATAKVGEADGKITYSVYPDGDESKTAYRTYSFDKEYMEEKNQEAKKADTDAPYDFKDYATMPYVNLGTLVLDGRGSAEELNKQTQYNDVDAGVNTDEPYGYTYTIQGYENDGLYFTRKNNTFGQTKLYYVANTAVVEATWKSVSGNASVTFITEDTTNASNKAVYYKTADGALAYIYVADNKIVRAIGEETVTMEESASGATLWKVENGYLYYTMAGTNGDTLLRINVNGAKNDYNLTWGSEEYFTSKFVFVDFNSAWYKPEMIDNMLLFSNAESFGTVSYNYVWAFNMNGANGLMTAQELNAVNEEYEAANEKISEIAKTDSDVEAVLKYVFRTGKVDKYEAIKDNEEYFDDDQRAKIASFVEDTTASYRQSYFVSMIGAYKADDFDAIEENWVESITPDVDADDEEEEEGLAGWQIALIVVASVFVLAGIAGAVAYFVLKAKKKEEETARANEIVNAYKKTIDVTDDKTVDVYSDEEEKTEEKVEENAEEKQEVVEELTEEVETTEQEEVVEEVTEKVETTESEEAEKEE